ncbi:MAG TPA: aminotransferase class V-fold PLP-dependent enzyme [Candidatus Lachnoclostridium stercorigallinarum]|uniref:Aminotransferase class V-fold PLP-dependent enzyme n=1 Tax=Candidatus Lachnoclostridium stercorigallinarum TaxID=2838634 RepID=A0A9D2K4G6_9FIRM|nr:aminotransferase class V-fold PLP-dependent enzyme [Candidatus Lachnoclostridium stercorigallinarum]
MDLIRKEQKREMGELMKGFVDSTLDFYENMGTQNVAREADDETIHRLKSRGIPAKGRPVKEVFEEMERDVYANQSLVQHPRCFACVPSPVSLFSWMGDIMTNAYDPHAGSWLNASGAGCIEQETIRWMCGLAGYPETAGGLFVSGGSMANLTALTAARDAKLTYADRELGVAYVSDQTHSSVAKGLHIIGFRPDQVRSIPSDSAFRMKIPELRAAIEADLRAGKKPFAVIATAGTTNTGSIDPLEEIAGICENFSLWMHVDGAYGASVLVSNTHRGLLKGVERSDSLSWDAHKWLMQTYGCSAVLVRDPRYLARTFAVHPEYLKDASAGEGEANFWDLGPELTRPARSLKLWITLQIMGSDAMSDMIDHGYKLAETAEKALRRLPDWEIISPAAQAVINFRYAPAGLSDRALDELNQKISRELCAGGFAQVLTTELNGKKVLRICALNPATTREDMLETVKLLDDCAREAVGRMSA